MRRKRGLKCFGTKKKLKIAQERVKKQKSIHNEDEKRKKILSEPKGVGEKVRYEMSIYNLTRKKKRMR